MKKTYIIKPFMLLLFCATAFTIKAQTPYVKQVLVANGGAFSFAGNYITIGSYNLAAKKYALFDAVTGGSVTQILIDGGYAYMATDSYLVKYDLASLQRVAITSCKSLRYIAIYKNEIVATIGYDLTTTHIKIFRMSDLGLIYSENKMPNIYCNGITIVGDSAYIALQGQYPSYNDTGRIAVEDLANQKFKRVITLDTATRGIGDMFAYRNTLVGVTEYPYSRVTEINLTSGAKNIVTLPTIGLPFALYNDSLYGQYANDLVSGIGGLSLNSNKSSIFIKPNPYYAGAALDTLNKLFYYTGGSYSVPTKTWIYDYNNKAIDSFNVGISPEGIAIDYEVKSGINEPVADAANLMLYPNPANSMLYLKGLNEAQQTISVMDMTGRVLMSQSGHANSGTVTTVPVAGLSAGIYLVSITTANGVVTRQFIKN